MEVGKVQRDRTSIRQSEQLALVHHSPKEKTPQISRRKHDAGL